MLTPLADWVENGIAPERIIATKYVNDVPTDGVERTRPLCPHPQTAQYLGKGSIDDAANFVCRASAKDQHDDDDHADGDDGYQ